MLLIMKYWFELLTPDYRSYECFIPDGSVAKAKRYALQYMRERGISEAILARNSFVTNNLLGFEELHV